MTAFCLTTPIYYVNDKPHLGHAYTSVACDVLARWARMSGRPVLFMTGTDEHGQKIARAAEATGETPRAFTDRVSRTFVELADALQVSRDDFIRTTEPRHRDACQAIWRRMAEKGDLYEGAYEGWYAVRDEAYYDEAELTTAPDGSRLGPSGAPVEWVREPSWFFRLSAYQQPLLDHYEANPDFIGPQSRRNEVVSFVRGGLSDLSVSRTNFDWGVPVPDAPSAMSHKHVMYVWLDALTNYLTVCGYPDEQSDTYRRFWPASLHMIGKDILRFHAVYWPAFLLSAGLPLPKRVFAHGWWTVEGRKMSKSLGNAVDPHAAIAEFGLDPFRFFLLREVPFGNDGDFSRTALIRRLNVELANDLGNLAQRTLSFIGKNAGAAVPDPGAFSPEDHVLLRDATALRATMDEALSVQAFHEALEAAWVVIREANAYIDHQAPWTLRKTDTARMATVLYVLAETLRRVALVLTPWMPGTMARLLDQLAVPASERSFAGWDTPLIPGTPLPAPAGLFPRFVEAAAAS